MKKIFVLLLTVLFYATFLMAGGFDFDYNGAVNIENSSQKEVFKKPDGTVITKFSDREEAVFKNKTKIVKYKDGSRSIYRPDATEITIRADKSTIFKKPDGSIEKISMDGKTPYGVEIQQQRRILRRKSFTVEIIYSAVYSDDVFNEYMKSIYAELISAVQAKLWKMKVPSGKRKIVISNCRFCKTGYCQRKNRKEIAFILLNGEREIKRTTLFQEDLFRKKAHPDLARIIVNKLL